MDKLNSRITELKENLDNNHSKYYELKRLHDLEKQKSIEKEYELKALKSKETLLTERFERRNATFNKNSENLKLNEDKIQILEDLVKNLTNDITEVEKKFDDLTLENIKITEELRKINQMIQGI
ncbi:hypothetical protein HYPBUDRAFT_6775 [Hyphopichia burtonii NRRL Y-1933]|uniref:Uncharacterized protein n=1 Tax=Hyphopichia burtonii NRRL Y-1933 TaxID=984485 RepID=A0A1E4RGG9_9ASCO|nr:hypothetical protein HYPBUDRAFT_6775 [Hyphopichia burtonii NRRL Y-1933]ODV66364.1 hypothetical protein HYPBUDRAFT_6775 [Hyphopichia burtonii NRRL Y-1933]